MTSVQPVKRSFCIMHKIEPEKAAELTPVDPSLIGLFRNATQQPRRIPRLEMMNDSKPCSPSDDFHALRPKRRRRRLRASCSPSPQPLSLRERESARTVLENSDVAVAFPLLCLSFRRHTATKLSRVTKPRANVSPSPGREGWGEGWGEGERSKLQPQAHDDSRNYQTSQIPRQSWRFPI